MGNHKGLPLRAVRRGNPLWLPLEFILRPFGNAKFILRPFGSAKFILRPFGSAKFILRPSFRSKFILRLDLLGMSVLYSIGKRY
ncbi:MAG: hypothetical protein DRR00_01650 [Candidatus Parabeggiatoa sp. nov. 3]|nr:MAG: hypothetical protein DRR00_01650 [Gammaproteobacteria bacterium]RKZ62790.1 MAG: hypothetical protein DRQ99_18240 [Gammaproteobacteria bacterium]